MSIESYPSPNGVLTSLIWRKTMSGGETSLSGYDNASQALSYTPGQEQVYLNGILLVRGDDYTATNGTTITGLSALAASDYVQVNCYNNFSVASVPAASLTGTVTNAQLANSAITINGSAVSLGGTVTLAGDIESVTATSPLTGGGSTGALTVGIQSASTTQSGAVQLSDSTSTTSSVLAATPTAVKSAYDLANGAIPKTLTTTTGDIIYASGANTPARLGIGSTGQVLGISSGLPAWSTPAAGGMTLIATATPSASTLIEFTSIPTTYKDLVIVGHLTPSANGEGSSRVRVLGDTGSHYISTIFSAADSTSLTGSTAWQLHNNMTNTKPMTLHWTMFDYANTTTQIKQSSLYVAGFHYVTTTNVSNQYGWRFMYYKGSTSAITSISFEPVVGTYTGTLYLYGVK